MKKRLLGFMLLFSSLFSTGVLAESPGWVGTLTNAVGWVTEIELGGSWAGEGMFWAKVITFFLVFTIFYWVGSKWIFADKPKFAGIIAALFGFITILIPKEMFKALFISYQMVFFLIMFGLPIAGLVFLARVIDRHFGESSPKFYHVVMAIITVLLMFILGQLQNSLAEMALSPGQTFDALTTFTSWLAFIYGFLNVYLVWHIVKLLFFSSAGQASAAVGGAGASWLGKKVKAGAQDYMASWSAERSLEKDIGKELNSLERSYHDMMLGVNKLLTAMQKAVVERDPETKQKMVRVIQDSYPKLMPGVISEEDKISHLSGRVKELQKWAVGALAGLKDLGKNLKDQQLAVAASTLPNRKKLENEIIGEIKQLDDLGRFATGMAVEVKSLLDEQNEAAATFGEFKNVYEAAKEYVDAGDLRSAYGKLREAYIDTSKFSEVLGKLEGFLSKNQTLTNQWRSKIQKMQRLIETTKNDVERATAAAAGGA